LFFYCIFGEIIPGEKIEMTKKNWKNVIGIVVLFGVIFSVLFFNFKIGFSVFDFPKTILNSLLLINVFIAFLSGFIAVLFIVFIIFIILYYMKRKKKIEEK